MMYGGSNYMEDNMTEKESEEMGRLDVTFTLLHQLDQVKAS